MGYKPKVGDLVEYTDTWNGDRKTIALVMKINKTSEHNGTVNIKLILDEKDRNYVYPWNLKLLSSAS